MNKQDKELLKTVLDKLEFQFTRDMLVKPLADEMVEKDVTKMVTTGKKDENGYEITDSKKSTEMVETTFRKGIVLCIPSNYQWPDPNNHPEVGDIVAYSRKQCIDFDLFKDSQIVNPYNVVAFIKNKEE